MKAAPLGIWAGETTKKKAPAPLPSRVTCPFSAILPDRLGVKPKFGSQKITRQIFGNSWEQGHQTTRKIGSQEFTSYNYRPFYSFFRYVQMQTVGYEGETAHSIPWIWWLHHTPHHLFLVVSDNSYFVHHNWCLFIFIYIYIYVYIKVNNPTKLNWWYICSIYSLYSL